MSTAKTAFPSTPTGIKVQGDPFTFTNQQEREEFGWGLAGRIGTRKIGGNYLTAERHEFEFAAAVAGSAEAILAAKPSGDGRDVLRSAYVAQAFSSQLPTIPTPTQVAKLLGGWVHADLAQTTFDPKDKNGVERAQIAALTQ